MVHAARKIEQQEKAKKREYTVVPSSEVPNKRFRMNTDNSSKNTSTGEE